MSNTFIKDPAAVKDYLIDWGTNWLDGDTLASVTWSVPTGITQDAATHTTTTATIWLSGGTAGVTYPIVCHITTAGGRADEKTIFIVARDE